MHKVHCFKTQKFINLGNEHVFFSASSKHFLEYDVKWTTITIVSKTAYSSRRIADRIAFWFSDPKKYLSLMRIGSVGDLQPRIGSKGQNYHQIPHLENFPGGIWILFSLLVSWRVYITVCEFFSFQLDSLKLDRDS